MPVYRSRSELERVLGRHGATDFAVVEADSSASIQFALQGRFVQLALPLPDPEDVRMTETASGRPRSVPAQERAYDQALREHWRAFVLAVRGKLQSVESGISTFDDEFASFLVPHLREDGGRKRRKKPRAVNWLLGSSHTVAIGLVAAFLVPTSAVSAFALPPSVVDHLSAPFSGVVPTGAGESSDDARPLALGSGSWANAEAQLDGEGLGAGEAGDLGTLTKRARVRTGSRGAAAGSDVDESLPADGSTHQGSGSPGDGENSGATPGGSDIPVAGRGGEGAPGAASSPPHGAEPSRGTDKPAGGGGPSKPAPGDGAGPSDGGQAPSEPGPANPGNGNADDGDDNGNHTGAGNGNDAGADNGNHTGAGNGNNAGADNANKNDADKGNQAGADNGNHYGADNGNHNGADNGNKAGDTGSGKPAAGKGQPQAGQ